MIRNASGALINVDERWPLRTSTTTIKHMTTNNPYAPPSSVMEEVAPRTSSDSEPAFFPVSITKLSVMSLCTLGIYELYWFYKNWHYVKARDRSDIWPAPRGVFAQFFCYQFFKRVRSYDVPAIEKSTVLAGPLAISWIATTMMYKLPDAYWWVSMFAFVFLIPVQRRINLINQSISPDHDRNSRFSALNWIGIVVGTAFVALALYGTFYPELED